MNFLKTNNRKQAISEDALQSFGPSGYALPRAVEVEKDVLGCTLIDAESWDTISGILSAECFYVDAHKEIFKAMKTARESGRMIDRHVLKDELTKVGMLETVGGMYYLDTLTTSITNIANVEEHCRIILQKYIGRQLIRTCAEIMRDSFEDMGDHLEILSDAQQRMSEIENSLQFGDMIDMSTAIVETVKQIEKWRQNEGPITGVSTGHPELDKATRGWQNTDMIILAARPSVGKTAFALDLVVNAGKDFRRQFEIDIEKIKKANVENADELISKVKQKTVALFSLEMKVVRLMLRMLARESETVLYKMQAGRMEPEDMKKLFEKGVQQLHNIKVKFDDRPGLTIQKLRSKCRRMKKRDNLGLIVIDYLQLMTGDKKGNREQEISDISRQLKGLAMELEVPVIALSQLSRNVEQRGGEPMLSDLRESGAIEQDADLVAFLFGHTEKEIAENAALKNVRYLKIAKQRDGFLTKISLRFRGEYQKFEEPESEVPKELGAGAWRPVPTQGVVDFSEPNKKEEDPF